MAPTVVRNGMSPPELSRSRPLKPWFSSVLTPFLVVICLLPALSVHGLAQQSSLTAISTLIRESKLEEADQQLQAILQKQPTNARAIALLGDVRRRQGKWPEAETLYRKAVAADPRSAEACQDLAALLRDAVGLRRRMPIARS